MENKFGVFIDIDSDGDFSYDNKVKLIITDDFKTAFEQMTEQMILLAESCNKNKTAKDYIEKDLVGLRKEIYDWIDMANAAMREREYKAADFTWSGGNQDVEFRVMEMQVRDGDGVYIAIWKD